MGAITNAARGCIRNLQGSVSQELTLAIRIRVPQDQNGHRLDVVLATLIGGVSRREARRLIGQGSVFIDGHRTRVLSRPVLAGAELRVEVDAAPAATEEPVEILWEGEGFVAVAKPSGIPTEPTRTASAGTLLERVRATLAARGERPTFLAAAHRLDVETSGVVLFATHSEAAARAGQAFQEGRADRCYLAVVDGVPGFERRTFDAPIACKDARRRLYASDPAGRPARTDVERVLVGEGGEGALLKVVPRTGRTHQIRVHLSEASHPIRGDVRYGGRPAPGFGLHALSLALRLDGGEVLSVVAPVPESFLVAASSASLSPAAVSDVAAALAREERGA